MVAIIMLIATGVLSLIVVWIVEGLFKRESPWGTAVDYLIGVVGGVGFAALDYFFLIPVFLGSNVAEWLRAGGSLLEGTGTAWLVLWIVRQATQPPLKRQTGG